MDAVKRGIRSYAPFTACFRADPPLFRVPFLWSGGLLLAQVVRIVEVVAKRGMR
jgi:hypothetical protein